MRVASIIMMFLGLAVAAGSTQAARTLLLPSTALDNAEPQMATVVVASREIRRGEILTGADFAVKDWPREAVPQGSFDNLDLLLPSGDGKPRRATRGMVAGEVVLAAKISDFGEKVTIVQSIETTSRAMAIKVDAVSAVGGLVTPGDFVDVLLTREEAGSLQTETILRRVKVVAVDQTSDELSEVPDIATTVTVEVQPEESQILALAQRAGTLSLALRSPDADEGPSLEKLRLADLTGRPPEPDLVAAHPASGGAENLRRRTVLERRGTDTREVLLRD